MADMSKANHTFVQINKTLNQSKEEDEEYMKYMYDNRHFSWEITSVFILSYAFVVIPGLVSNLLILTTVIKNSMLCTPLNILISNLALSDCLLCFVNVPSTLIEICCYHWPLTDMTFLCKIFGLSQGLVVFVSTITIVVIAIDRYQIMFYPTENKLTKSGAVKVIFLIWIVSLVLASPLYFVRNLNTYEQDLPDLKFIQTCSEVWPIVNGRTYYSLFSLIIQYLLPFIVVSYTYVKIYIKVNGKKNLTRAARQEREREKRLKKTNSLLVGMALAQSISWLPLNILNLYGDIFQDNLKDMSSFFVAFFVCHLLGISTVITNPLLYGYYNDNFRKVCFDFTACRMLRKGSHFVGEIPYVIEEEDERQGNLILVELTETQMTSVSRFYTKNRYHKKRHLSNSTTNDTQNVDDTSV